MDERYHERYHEHHHEHMPRGNYLKYNEIT